MRPSYRPGVTWTDLRQCLPDFVVDTLAGALPLLGQKLRGYDDPDAVLTAVESRSSSPVRIPRDKTCQSSLRGLYPCRRHPLRRRGRYALCRTTLSIQ